MGWFLAWLSRRYARAVYDAAILLVDAAIRCAREQYDRERAVVPNPVDIHAPDEG